MSNIPRITPRTIITDNILIYSDDGSSSYLKLKCDSGITGNSELIFPGNSGKKGFLKNTGNGIMEYQGDSEEYIIVDEKPVGSDGGTFSAGSWNIRNLNKLTKFPLDSANVSLGTDEFTLQPGGYTLSVLAPAYKTKNHQCRLYNITDDLSYYGTSEFSESKAPSMSVSKVTCIIEIDKETVFRVEHKCSNKGNSNGFGVASGFSKEVYTMVNIKKIS